MSKLTLEKLTKRYGEVFAVKDVSLEIPSGEFFSFLGPSGCGKTTILRMIAGLEYPTAGRILVDDVDITATPPQKRDAVMVFQNYALFPHMTVAGNVAFGLEVRKFARSEIQKRVRESLSQVRLDQKFDAHVQDLSGGEQQRVALARALAVRPKILLMDEPLSNLDVTLRAETRLEIKQLQEATGITTVYVTHDQEEALGISDRIAVIEHGKVIQVGTPMELYTQPKDPFVAAFLGNANLLSAQISRLDGKSHVLSVSEQLRFRAVLNKEVPQGSPVLVAIRPEHLCLVPVQEPHDFTARVEAREFQGLTIEYRVRTGETVLRVVMDAFRTRRFLPHEEVGVRVDPEHCFVYTVEGA